MTLKIKKHGVLSLREQIKRQIKLLITNGGLKPGQPLPSARETAGILNINRNTVTHAYKELCGEGLLETIVGSGTYVKKTIMLKSKKPLDEVFDAAIKNAVELGFDIDEISEHFINRISFLSMDRSRKKIFVVECNEDFLKYLTREISDRLGVQTEGILVQKLESNSGKAFRLFDSKSIVVCGLNHFDDVRKSAERSNAEVIALLYRIEARVINRFSRLPRGTKVGMVCVNRLSADTLYNSSYFSGGRELERSIVGFNDGYGLEQMVRECDVIFATDFIYDKMAKIVKTHQKLINVKLALDKSCIDLIKEKLSRL